MDESIVDEAARMFEGTHRVDMQFQKVDDPESFGWINQFMVRLTPFHAPDAREIAKVAAFVEPIRPADFAKGLRKLADAIEEEAAK